MRRPRRLILLAALILVLVAVGAALRHEDSVLPGGVQGVPTPPGAKSDRERTPLPDPFAYDPDRRQEFEQRAAAGTAHILYARSPGGALASAQRTARWRPQIEAAAKQRRRRPQPARGARLPRERGPPGRDGGRHRGRRRPDPDPRRDRPEPARDADRRGPQPPLHAPHPARAAEGEAARRPAAPGRPRQGRPALRPRAGAAGHRALPDDGQGALQARGHGLRLVPHGHGEPRERPARLRDRARRHERPLHPGLLRLEPGPPQRRLRQAQLVRRRLLELPVEARRRRADHAAEPHEPRRARASGGRADRQGVRRGGAAPAGFHPALRDARAAAAGMGGRAARRLPAQRARDRPARRPPHGRARAAPRQGPGALRGAAPGGARHRALHRRRGARAVRPGAAGGDLDRARRRLPEAARRTEPRGDPQLLAAHHRLGVRHRPPVPLEGARPRVPVRARPPPGARRDRLGARARRHPHHRRAGGEGAAPLLKRVQPGG